jgi:Glycosyl hydrolases family 38 C-terminal domain
MSAFHLAFDLRYYNAYQGFEGTRSGATVFRPAQNESLRYSNITKILVQQHEVVSQFTLVYKNAANETAVVKVRMTFDSPLLEWDVALETVPVNRTGKEVTVNFYSVEITNTFFYTDTNGLEMMERYLYYRPSFWYEPASPHNNVSVNFFPVTSAIAIRDDYGNHEREQLTVMVPRTMAGSSMEPGSVQLLHTRRLLYDD